MGVAGAARAADAATTVSAAGTEATADSGDAYLSPMAVKDTLAGDVGEAGDGRRAAPMGPSEGPTAAALHAAFGVFKAAFDVPVGPVLQKTMVFLVLSNLVS